MVRDIIKTCMHCGRGGLRWGQDPDTGWRLYDQGKLHACPQGFANAAARRTKQPPRPPRRAPAPTPAPEAYAGPYAALQQAQHEARQVFAGYYTDGPPTPVELAPLRIAGPEFEFEDLL